MKDKEYITIPEFAKLLGISRITIYKRVKKGEIKAKRVGRNYAIDKRYLYDILGEALGEKEKGEIDRAVHKTVKEYGEVLKLLGRE